ncbi:zinc-dependent metalloprotease family protein [Arthrobacter sp. TMN-49]
MKRRLLAAGLALGLAGTAAVAVPMAVAAPSPALDTTQSQHHGHSHGKSSRPFPGAVNSAEALAKGNTFLAKGAAVSGIPVEKLKAELKEDDSLWLNKVGSPLYVEPAASSEELAQAQAQLQAPAAAAPDPAQAFNLSSSPGSARIIFIDFDGAQTTGTQWNTDYGQQIIQSQPYDSDGDPATFSVTERQQIVDTWQRVVEDYSAFNVNVTTIDPGTAALNRTTAADLNFGSHLVVSPSNHTGQAIGGIAYVGTFDAANNGYNQPAFVFTTGVGNTGKNIAEAGSHEVGHNLGLSHDGTSATNYYTGHAAWAPIMGVGYNRPVSQWSKGEYAGANQKQDDYAVMQQNGIALKPSTHGTSRATATALTPQGPAVAGTITTPADAAYYKVTLIAGSHKISATPAAVGANLDIKISVLNSAGALIASADPATQYLTSSNASGLDAEITRNYTAGTYYIKLEGTGLGNPLTTGYTDYGSIGNFSVTAS